MQGVFFPELWRDVVAGLRVVLTRPFVFPLDLLPLSTGDLVFASDLWFYFWTREVVFEFDFLALLSMQNAPVDFFSEL